MAFGVGLNEFEASVGVHGRPNVEAFLGTEIPRSMSARVSMNKHATTNWSERSLVEVKWTLEVFPGRDPRIDGRLPK